MNTVEAMNFINLLIFNALDGESFYTGGFGIREEPTDGYHVTTVHQTIEHNQPWTGGQGIRDFLVKRVCVVEYLAPISDPESVNKSQNMIFNVLRLACTPRHYGENLKITRGLPNERGLDQNKKFYVHTLTVHYEFLESEIYDSHY